MDVLNSSVVSSFVPKSLNRGKILWPENPSIKQNWAFRDSFINYICKNPLSAKYYLKLAQSCKFFFEKNPILIIGHFESSGNYFVCPTKLDEYQNDNEKYHVEIDLSKILSKIWIAPESTCNYGLSGYILLLLSKLYRCETSYFDGKTVMIDQILGCLPNVEDFQMYTFRNDLISINSSAMKNITKLENHKKLEWLHFLGIPESFTVEDLSAFFDKYINTKIWLEFGENLSDDFKNQLDSLIDSVIESGAYRFIGYDGQDDEKYCILWYRFYPNYDEEYGNDSDDDE
uniref:Uncharacterized protein n=1 Tax=Panagrolaimus davidi TaxID=227884 RepID=A0A914PPB5_9BILA